MVVCVDFVVGRDVGCCKLWTIWRHAASFMSRFVMFTDLKQWKISILTVNKSGIVTLTVQHDMIVSVVISKKHFRLGEMASSEWTRFDRAVRDTPVADYSAPGVNSTHRVAYRSLIAI